MTDEPMMMTWPSDELGRRLAAYAFALSPRTDASARLRASVMASAAETLRPIAAPRVQPAPVARRPAGVVDRPVAIERAGFGWLRRRVAVAAFTMGIGAAGLAGVVAAAQPGGALYETRLWAEALTLPAESNARVDADVGRLDARIGEARRAGLAGNAAGTTAALDAYVHVLDDAVAAAGTDSSRDERIVTALDRHRALLVALAARLPAPAIPALDSAIDRTDAAIAAVASNGSNGRGVGPADAGRGSGAGDAGGNGKGIGGTGDVESGGNAGGGRGPSAVPNASNDRSVKPGQSKTADPKPAATTAPTSTSDPSHSPSAKDGAGDSTHGGRAQLGQRTGSSPSLESQP